MSDNVERDESKRKMIFKKFSSNLVCGVNTNNPNSSNLNNE